MHLVPLLQQRRNTHSSTRTHRPSSLESRDSTSISIAYSSSSTLTTSHSCTFSMSQRQCHSWCLRRIQRWALTLSADTYTIQYKAGKDHANVDGLSWLPHEDAPTEVPKPAEAIFLMDHLAALPSVNQLATSDCRLTMTLPCPRQGSLSNVVDLPSYQTPVTCIHFIAGDTS